MLNCFLPQSFSNTGEKSNKQWLICWLRPAAVWSRSFLQDWLILIPSPWCDWLLSRILTIVNDVKIEATEECVCVYAAVCEARRGPYALHKDHARNLYKQSRSHNGFPAKHWVSHQPQLTTHKHKCTSIHTGAEREKWESKANMHIKT